MDRRLPRLLPGDDIVSPQGGRRKASTERWDLIPYHPMRWLARVYAYGAIKYDDNNWKKIDFDSEQNPLSHGLAHAMESMEYPPGSPERCWLLAKATWNLIARLWFELTREGSTAESGYKKLLDDLLNGDSELG